MGKMLQPLSRVSLLPRAALTEQRSPRGQFSHEPVLRNLKEEVNRPPPIHVYVTT